MLEDTNEYISYAPKDETKAQDRRPFDLLVCVKFFMCHLDKYEVQILWQYIQFSSILAGYYKSKAQKERQ